MARVLGWSVRVGPYGGVCIVFCSPGFPFTFLMALSQSGETSLSLSLLILTPGGVILTYNASLYSSLPFICRCV